MPIPANDPLNKLADVDLDQKLLDVANAAVEKYDRLSNIHPSKPSDGLGRTLADVGIKLGQGVVDLGQAAVGLGSLATGGAIGQGMRAIGYDPEATNRLLGSYLSRSQQEADRKVAEASGFVDTLKTSLENPRSILGSVAESVPGMVAGMGVTGAVARNIGIRAALNTVEGRLAAETAKQAGKTAFEAGEAALSTAAGRTAAQEAISGAETRLIGIGAGTEGAQSSGQIADQAQAAGRDYSDYALPAVAAGVGTAAINLGAGKLMGDAATDMAAGTHTLTGSMVKKMAKEGFSEGVLEEMPQSAQEQVFTNIAMGEQDTMKGVGNAAASGLLAGAAMGAGMGMIHAPAEIGQAKAEKAAKAAGEFQRAVVDNKPETFTQADTPEYSPSKAIGVLIEQNRLPDTTPAARAQNLDKAGEVLDEIYARAKELQAKAKGSNKVEAKKAQAELVQLARHKEAAQNAYDGMVSELEASMKPADVEAIVQTANAPAEQANPAAIDTVINLSMASSQHISPEQAQTLADNVSNGLSDDQRKMLRVFSAARQAENQLSTMGKVSQEVLAGSDKNVGIAQYRTRIGAAIRTGNEGVANKQLGMLASFARDHAAKATAAAQAMQQGQGYQIAKIGTMWKVLAPKTMTNKELKANGGLTMNSEKLVKAISIEARALELSRREMSRAIDMHFSSTPAQAAVQTGQAPVQSESSAAPTTSEAPLGSPASLFREKREREGRVEEGEPSSPQKPVVSPSVEEEDQKVSVAQASQQTTSSPRVQVGPNATGFTNVNAQAARDQSDMLGLTGLIEDHFASGKTVNQVRAAMQDKLKAMPKDEHAPFIINVRATLGIPSQDTTEGKAEFLAWKKEYDQRKASNSSLPSSPASEPSAPIAGADAPTQGTVPSLASAGATATQAAAAPQAKAEQQASAPAESAAAKAEPAEEETSKQAAEQVDPLGLAAQRTPAGESRPYQKRNLIADFFSQRAGAEDGTQRPLAKVKDFLSAVFQNPGLIKEYLAQKTKITSEQDSALTKFFELAKDWQDAIKANLPKKEKKNELYRYIHMMDFLTDEKGDVAENVKTAIAYSVFTWIAENSTRSAYATDKEINAILHKDEDAEVSPAAQRVLGTVGNYQGIVIQSLGQKIVQALGLKATKEAPLNLQPQLESVLGAHAMKLMLDHGLLQRTVLSGLQMKELTGSQNTDETAQFFFLRLARNEDMSLVEQAEAIAKSVRGSKGVIDKLFSVEPGLKMPATAPIPLKQTTTKSGQEVPAAEAKLIEKENAAEHLLNTDMWNLLQVMSEDQALLMAGARLPDPKTVHKSNRDGMKAKNDGLVREYQRLLEFFAGQEDITTPIFFEHDIWKQQRVGILTNMINPQTSKIHRHMLYRPSWESTIKTSEPNNLLLRIAEGLGVKTDKQDNITSLAKVNEKLAEPVFTDAINALAKQLNKETLTEAEKDAIVTGVDAGGENFHSLASLMAAAQYQNAVESGVDNFTVRLMGEVDGVTNGPMLSHLLMGAAPTVDNLFELLNKGGFFQMGSSQDQYNLWRAVAGHMDLYESTTAHMLGVMKDFAANGITSRKGKMLMKPARVQQVFEALKTFTGNLGDETKVEKAGRDIIKTPLTAMAFGSSPNSAVQSMADRFVESVYGKIEEMAGLEGSEQEALRVKILHDLQTLGLSVSMNATVEQMMNNTFSADNTRALKDIFKTSVGAAVKSTINTRFGSFLEQRNTLNQTAQLAFALYNAAYTTVKEAYLQELIERGEIESRDQIRDGKPTGKKVVLHDLNQVQRAELNYRLGGLKPIMATAFSQESKQHEAGLLAANTDRASSEDPHYTTEVHFGTKFADNNAGSVLVHSYEQTLADPGVAPASMLVHSTDAHISLHAGEQVSSLNVHDARGTGVAELAKMAEALNQATFNSMLAYSPMGSVTDTLLATLQAIPALFDRSGPELQQKLAQALAEAPYSVMSEQQRADGATFASLASDAIAAAHRADDMKLQALSQLSHIDQYALEGGHYEVTKDDREAASVARDRLKDATKDKRKRLDKLLAKFDKLTAQQQQPVHAAPQKRTNPKPVAKLGKPHMASDQRLVKAFEAKPNMAVKEVVALLRQSKNTDFYQKLLSRIERTVDGELSVRFITAQDTEADMLEGAPMDDHSRARYVALDWTLAGQRIEVMSPEFEQSGLTDETLVHELVHAALVRVVRQEQDKRNSEMITQEGEAPVKPANAYTSDALKLVEELEALMETVRQHIKDTGVEELEQFYAPMMENLDEFIAYGMTNPMFQEQILKAVVFQSKTHDNRLVKAWQAFIDAITALIFGRRNTTMSSGLEVMIQNVTGLLAAAEEASVKEGKPSGPIVRSMSTGLQDLSTTQLYDALDGIGNTTVSAGFDAKLRTVLDKLVDAVHGPFGAFKASITSTLATPLDVWADAKVSGKAPFAASVLASGLTFSEQEAFVAEQMEATMRTILDDKDGSTTAAYRELVHLYDDVRAHLQPSDFPSQAAYDFVFGIQLDASNRSTYLARFVALGLANEQMDKLLDFATPIKSTSLAGLSISDKLHALFERFMDWIHGKLTHTFQGQEANEKLLSLVSTLVDIEQKKRIKLSQSPGVMLDMVENTFRSAAEKGRETLAKIGESKIFKDSSNGIVKLTGRIATMVAKDRMDKWADALQTFRDVHLKEKNGLLMGLVNEVRGANAGNANFYRMLRTTKHIEGQRKDLIANTAQFTRDSFKDGSKYISKEANAALTAVALRTDMSVLLNHGFNMGDLHKLVSDPAYLAQQIQKFEGKLNGFGANAMPYRNLSKILAYKMATGYVTHRDMLMNAEAISVLADTPQHGKVSQADAKRAEAIIDPLVTLHALAYSSKTQLKLVAEVMATENGRGHGENGVEMILRQHAFLQQQSKDRLFNTAGLLRLKGYVPEIYNPYISIRVADARFEGKDLEAQGYVKSDAPLPMDAADPDRNEHTHIYTLRDGGLQRYQSGIMSNTSMRARGALQHNGDLSITSQTGQANYTLMNQIKRNGRQDTLDLMAKPFDPSKARGQNYLAKVINAQGEATNYRYMMNEATKNSLLERDNRFDQVLGQMAGNIFDKEESAVQNRKAVEALHDQYREEFATRAGSYVMVGPNSRDPEMRQIWRLLPENTKQAIREVWGNNNMMVRIDLLDINFGYRKLSLSDPFGIPEEERGRFEKMYVEFFEGLMGKKAAVKLRKFEDVWQALVREAKDTMVVKSGLTLLGNFTSNVSELIWFGVPMTDIVKHHRVALKGVLAYRKDSGELAELQNRLDTGHLQGMSRSQIQHRVNQLQDALARNPVRELIDAGLMPTIVEDVANEEDQYSFKGKLTRKVDEVMEKVNPHVLQAGKLLVMAHDTPLYQIMSYGTQVSDFIARYTLYQHVINRAKDPLDAKTAVQLVSDAFVNYDVPSHRTVQYANDMGLVYFSKYYLRIQKVIALLYRQNPGRALMLLTAGHFLDFLPMLTHSSALHRFGNPFSMGAFEAIGSLDEMATVNALMTPFR